MPQRTASSPRKTRLPGFDSEATPVLGVGLGLTGLLLGLRPRLAAWPLALTALAALLYRDPKRTTPAEPLTLFAPADGTVIGVDEIYEHRFLHTEAVRIAIAASPFDVPVHRSPAAGKVAYLEHVDGENRPVWDARAADENDRHYVGIITASGPVLLVLIGGPLARRLTCNVGLGQRVEAGARLCTARFGARVDMLLPRDMAELLPTAGERVHAGTTRIAHVAQL